MNMIEVSDVRYLIAGFTGTRTGLTSFQRQVLLDFLAQAVPSVLHHGDCLGADAEAHYLARVLDILKVIHPPAEEKYRAWSRPGLYDVVLPSQGYIARNHAIVDASDYLIACPKGPEVTRSGTWATVRYARHTGKTTYILYPDGRVEIDSKPHDC